MNNSDSELVNNLGFINGKYTRSSTRSVNDKKVSAVLGRVQTTVRATLKGFRKWPQVFCSTHDSLPFITMFIHDGDYLVKLAFVFIFKGFKKPPQISSMFGLSVSSMNQMRR